MPAVRLPLTSVTLLRTKKQAKQYEEWMLSGKSDGLVLCSNCCADVGLETVPWTKQWLREIGNIELK